MRQNVLTAMLALRKHRRWRATGLVTAAISLCAAPTITTCTIAAFAAPVAPAITTKAKPVASAEPAPWQIDRAHSLIEFSASQAGAKFTGHFGKWNADIHFVAANLAHSIAVVDVFIASLDSQNEDRDNALKSSDWFDPARWPQARFVTRGIRATKSGYEADATLTIRGHTRPVRFQFQVQNLPGNNVRLQGSARLARLDFDLGQGDFKSTEWVGNDVDVRVVVVARAP